MCAGHRDGQPAIVLLIFFCSPHSHGRRIRMLSCSTLHNCATFRKPPGFYKSVAHFYSCLHSDIRLHTLAQFQINSKLGKYYYLSYLLLHRQKTESHIWVNMCSRELQTECSGVVCLQWLDSWTLQHDQDAPLAPHSHPSRVTSSNASSWTTGIFRHRSGLNHQYI